MTETTQLHATCVSIGGRGVLLLGDPGAGKSDLALRLIEAGAELVADDRVNMSVKNRELVATAPEKLSGLIEARGVGLLSLHAQHHATIALAVKLVAREQVERMPEPEFFDCLGLRVPLLSLHAFDLSTESKIRLYLQRRR